MSYSFSETFDYFLSHLCRDIHLVEEDMGPRGEVHEPFDTVRIYDCEDLTISLQPRALQAVKNLAQHLNCIKGPLEFYTFGSTTPIGSMRNILQSDSIYLAEDVHYREANEHDWSKKFGSYQGLTTYTFSVKCRGAKVFHKTIEERWAAKDASAARYEKRKQTGTCGVGV